MNSFEELNRLIIDWANDRNLITKDNSFKQLAKCISELGELSDALLEKDEPGIKDGLGDTIITLIILAEQNGLNPVDCLNSAYQEIKERTGKTVNGTFIKDEPKINEAMQKDFNETIWPITLIKSSFTKVELNDLLKGDRVI